MLSRTWQTAAAATATIHDSRYCSRSIAGEPTGKPLHLDREGRSIVLRSAARHAWTLRNLTVLLFFVAARKLMRNDRWIHLCLKTLAIVAVLLLSARTISARDLEHPSQTAPTIVIPRDATVDAVTVQTYGQVSRNSVWRYLTLRKGARLEQETIDHDYLNLVKLGGYRVRLVVGAGSGVNTMTLHWIVMSPWFRLTAHPLYEEAPLSDPTRGVGFAVTSPQVSTGGANVALVTSQNRWAHHVLATFTSPIDIDPVSGRESDVIVSVLREQDAYRVSAPRGLTIYNWTSAAQAQYLLRWTNGTQIEAGLREERSTGAPPNGIVAPSLSPTTLGTAKNTIAAIGASHACNAGPTGGWYPPYCHTQFRAAILDGVGGLGATSTFQVYSADVVQYVPIRTSTLALHAVGIRTGGVLPESRTLCAAALRGYADPFCGTDGSLLQAEYRIGDAAIQNLKFSIFTETGATRIRGGNQPWAPFKFQWHPDSGIEVRFNGLAIDLARGQLGYRLNFFLTAQVF